MTGQEKLESIISEIDTLISKQVSASSPEFKAWHMKAERFLIRQFGESSIEVSNFRKTQFSLSVFTLPTPQSEFIDACKRGLTSTKAIFKVYLDEFEEPQTNNKSNGEGTIDTYESVFIVHGHDTALRESIARLLEQQNIKPIILQQQVTQGAETIIEKFESLSDNVSAAICLFTADDEGKAISSNKLKNRARQNVVFETGYFIGKLSRSRVIIVADKGIEIPSDLQGVLYTDSSSWNFEILRGLKNIGYNVDLNKLC